MVYMSEILLNMLPLEGDEAAAFEAVLPDAEHIYAGRRSVTPEQLARATIIMGWPRVAAVAQAKNLKWLHSLFSGVDEYTGANVLPPDVTLTTSTGTNSQSVAEHTLACLLALCRKLHAYRDYQTAHRWVDEGAVRTISGATVLVVGAGSVGRRFAGLCKALGATTIGLRRSAGDPGAEFDELRTLPELDTLLPQADVVGLFLPHSPETQGLFDRARIGRMKPGSILLSAGRGTVLDQDALADALRDGHLWGAAADVTVPEPLPADHPLWDAPNLILTPHVAGGMRLPVTRKNCIELALENLRRYTAGEALINRVSAR